jgi:hypothetical protein
MVPLLEPLCLPDCSALRLPNKMHVHRDRVVTGAAKKRGNMARNIARYLPPARSTAVGLASLSALALAGAAIIVNRQAAKAEKAYPP